MKVISIIKKDLKIILSDKKALVIILVMPIILMSILSFALKGIFVDDWEINQISIAIVKQYDAESDDKRFHDALQNGLLSQGMGQEARESLLSAGNDANPENIFFHDFLEIEEVADIISYRLETEKKAKALLHKGKISAIVLLPEKYIYNMKVNLLTPFRNKVEIKVLTNPDDTLNGQIVRTMIEAYSDTMSSMVISKNVLIESIMANDIANDGFDGVGTIMEEMSEALESIQVEMAGVNLEGRNPITSANYYAAAMLTMFILFAAGHGGRMLLEERENTTFQRMTVAGISKLGILTGKFFTVFFIAIFQIIVMMAFSRFALHVQWGDMPAVVLIGITSAFAVAGVGAAVAAAAYQTGNDKMANIFQTIIIQMMALVGGSFVPIDTMPAVFQKLSFLSLNGIALKAYQKTMMGYPMEAVLGYVAVLVGIGTVFAILAVTILEGKGDKVNGKYNQTKTARA